VKSARNSKGDSQVGSFLSTSGGVAKALLGKQLFERSRDWAEDESLAEDDISVDVTQYERTHETEEENEGDRVYFSDSD
jgi:hypothetical protein